MRKLVLILWFLLFYAVIGFDRGHGYGYGYGYGYGHPQSTSSKTSGKIVSTHQPTWSHRTRTPAYTSKRTSIKSITKTPPHYKPPSTTKSLSTSKFTSTTKSSTKTTTSSSTTTSKTSSKTSSTTSSTTTSKTSSTTTSKTSSATTSKTSSDTTSKIPSTMTSKTFSTTTSKTSSTTISKTPSTTTSKTSSTTTSTTSSKTSSTTMSTTTTKTSSTTTPTSSSTTSGTIMSKTSSTTTKPTPSLTITTTTVTTKTSSTTSTVSSTKSPACAGLTFVSPQNNCGCTYRVTCHDGISKRNEIVPFKSSDYVACANSCDEQVDCDGSEFDPATGLCYFLPETAWRELGSSFDDEITIRVQGSCANATCNGSHLKDGVPCSKNYVCSSEYCNTSTDTCGKLTTGSYCYADLDCESGECKTFSEENPGHYCVSHKLDGQSCANAYECDSYYCNSFKQSGLIDDFKPCAHNEDCKSRSCPRIGRSRSCAASPVPDGQPCTQNSGCAGGYCNPNTNKCGPGRFGDRCQYNSDCFDQDCNSFGTCGALPDGSWCWLDFDCQSFRCNSRHQCGRLDDGGSCFDDDECKTYFCRHNICGKSENGLFCEADDECISSYCSEELTCEDVPGDLEKNCTIDSDCPVSEHCNTNLQICGTVMNGQRCNQNADCRLGICDTNVNVCGYNQLDYGQTCVEDRDCRPGKCNSFKQCGQIWRGGACNVNEDCYWNYCTANQTCDYPP